MRERSPEHQRRRKEAVLGGVGRRGRPASRTDEPRPMSARAVLQTTKSAATGALCLCITEVEIKGVVKPLADWLAHMFKNDITKLRCETPFRASESEAAFVRVSEGGDIFIYDAGTETIHYAPRFPWSDAEVSDAATTFEEFETLSAMVDARQAKRLREAQAAFTIITDEEIEAAREQYHVDTLEDVKAAARALKAGDVEAAKAALERLAQLHGRTAVDDDFVLALIKRALGKPATMGSLRSLLRDVDARRRRGNGDDDDGFDLDEGGGGGAMNFSRTSTW
jgi:hypothetical protein